MSIDSFVQAMSMAFAEGEPERLTAILVPGAVLWHNNDGVEQPAAVGMSGVTALAERVEGLRLEVHDQGARPGGGYVRFTVRGRVRATGRELAARNCVFVLLRRHRLDHPDGRVRRPNLRRPAGRARLIRRRRAPERPPSRARAMALEAAEQHRDLGR